jgi:phosphopantothenate synthetase
MYAIVYRLESGDILGTAWERQFSSIEGAEAARQRVIARGVWDADSVLVAQVEQVSEYRADYRYRLIGG